MANVFNCPTDCSNTDLPVTDFSDCISQADMHLSEVSDLFIANGNAEGIETPEDATEWLARVSQTDLGADAIRPLTVIADKPAATSTPIEISKGRTVNGIKTNTINFTVDVVTTAIYDFFRILECGGNYKFWYQTRGGFLYGGTNGIKIKSITVDPILERGDGSYENITGVITWESSTSFTDRIKSPIADHDFDAANGTDPEV